MTPTTATTLNQSATNLNELAALHASLLVGVIGNAISTGQAGDNATPSTPLITNRPWVDPPDGFTPFDTQLAILLPAVGSSAVVVSHTCPDGMDGVINQFSWNFTGGGFVQGSGDLVVQVLRGNAAVRNFEAIVVEKGSIAQARPISPIRIFSGQTISIVITHAANVTLAGNIVGALVGYDYPSKS